jgi:outer membrane protein TolC
VRLFAALFLISEFLFQPALAQAQEVTGAALEPLLTLGEVLEEARNENPEILAARKGWEVEKALVWAARSWPDPEVGVEFWGKNETWYDVSQKIPFPGKPTLKARVQTHQAKRQYELYQAKEKEILQKVKAAYYAYFLSRRQIELFEESAGLLKHFSKVAEDKYSVNRASQVDVLKAQVEYSKSFNALAALAQEKETTRAELNALLNRPPDAPLGKPQEPPLGPFGLTYEDLEKVALENRPEVHAARHHVDHMKAEVWSARADYLPDTMLQYSRRTFDSGIGEDDNIVMIKFNVPFLWFWRQGSLVKAAKKAKEQAEAELRSMETMTRSEVKSIQVKVETARRQVELYRTSVLPQAEASLKVATAGYESGTVGFLELLDSHRSWLEFQMEYYQYLAAYWSYLAALERVAGKDLVPFEAAIKEAATA